MIVVMVQDKTMLARTNSKNVPSSFTVMLLNPTNDQLGALKHDVLILPIVDFRLPIHLLRKANSQSKIGNRKSAIQI